VVGGRALRARTADPPAKESKLNLTRATIALAFYRRHPLADCQQRVFQQPQGTSPRKRAASRHHARNRRGCLIANPTSPGKKNPTFQNQPVFSCVLDAASVSTRINTRYQADNRCRQRHRVRKAVFVQLVRICPKAFCNVVRSGQ
jgi:hypothetical protein